jgi:predicted peptidase
MWRIWLISLWAGCIAHAVQPEAREWKASGGSVVKYRWSAPTDPEAGKTYPLVLFLHGSGERGSDNTAQLRHGVMPILKGAEALGQPCYLIAPQCPEERLWSPIDPEGKQLTAADRPNGMLDPIIELINGTLAKYPVDPTRLYVTGISMGGFGVWDLLARMPGKIAAAVPICGGGDPTLAARFKDVPIHAFHGELDSAVPVAATRDMIVALEKAGGKPKVTIYPGVDHVCWVQVYDDPELYRWIFAQRR